MKRILLSLIIGLACSSLAVAALAPMVYDHPNGPCPYSEPGGHVSGYIHVDSDGNGSYDTQITVYCDGLIEYGFWGCMCEIGRLPENSGPWHFGALDTSVMSSGVYAFSVPILTATDSVICAIYYAGGDTATTSCNGKLWGRYE